MDATFGFNSAQVGFLEVRLHDRPHAAEDAHVHDGYRPSDKTLPPWRGRGPAEGVRVG
jgi:hypothetical protein